MHRNDVMHSVKVNPEASGTDSGRPTVMGDK